MSDTTQHTPADVREPTDAQINVWSIIRSALSRAFALSRPWAVVDRPRITSEVVVARLDAIATDCEREVLAALRTPAAPAPGWSEVRERANTLRAALREHGFERLRSALVGQHSDAVFYGQWERHKALLRDLLDALDAALRSEAQGDGPVGAVCANCGAPNAKIAGGELDPDEAVCSSECYDQLKELGCPQEHGGTYRPKPARRGGAQGEEDVGEVCHLCGEEFDPRESGTVTGPLGQDDGVPRWYRCPRCARAYDTGYQQGQRDPRGDETADPTALRSEAQGEGWQVTEPARDIVRREMPETRATVREAIRAARPVTDPLPEHEAEQAERVLSRAAIHSETPGVTRCRICCERPAALTLCTECADEALWRSIYDQWLAEEATNARFRALMGRSKK